ncbi:hypothetical protein J6590_058048 [Homalodisca vitripennis]|nr:hypothetical protein J6590_058048 [Homalodisca vitripennis]
MRDPVSKPVGATKAGINISDWGALDRRTNKVAGPPHEIILGGFLLRGYFSCSRQNTYKIAAMLILHSSLLYPSNSGLKKVRTHQIANFDSMFKANLENFDRLRQGFLPLNMRGYYLESRDPLTTNQRPGSIPHEVD